MQEFKPGYVRVVYNKSLSRYEIRNYLMDTSMYVTPDIAYFVRELDGKKHPLEIGRELGWEDRKTVGIVLDLLDNYMIRESRVLTIPSDGFINIHMITLWTPRWIRPPKSLKILCLILTALITFSFLPALITGIILIVKNPVTSEDIHWLLFPVIVLFCILMHEVAGHLASGAALGADIYEAGVTLGGAYILIDDTGLQNKWCRAQISAAGIEANLLVAGCGMILAAVLNSRDLWWLAILNLCLALTNLAPIIGSDGNAVAAALLGFDPAKTANKVCRTPGLKDRLYEEEYGLRVVLTCYLIRATQVILFGIGMAVCVLAW